MKRTLRNHAQQGFTLIELMIVVAILAILLAIAIPAYQDYLARARASEALTMAAPAKLAVSESVLTSNNGAFPTTNAEAGYSFAGDTTFVADIQVGNNGEITVTAQNTQCKGGEPVFTLTPTTTGSSVEWSCTAIPTVCAPASCR